MDTVAVIGLATAFFAATIGMTQMDIKKVFAYSTVSQLGYMFLGVGVGAFSAGIFHLMTHAFFKALLFLGAGAVIHGLHGEQDLRQMGGLFKHMPITAITLLCASLAISGFPVYVRLLQQRRDSGGRLRARAVDVLGGRAHRGHDRVLRLPRLVHGVHRRVSGPRASARIAAGDDRPADDPRGFVARRRLHQRAAHSWSRCSPRRPENQGLAWLSAGVGMLGILLAYLFYVVKRGLAGFGRESLRRPLHAGL